MSVMTAGEQRRRAGATRGRPPAASTPGQQTVTAGEPRPGPATSGRRHRAAGQRTRHLTVVPAPQSSKAAPPRDHAEPPKARGSQTRLLQATGSRVMPPEKVRPETAQARPVRTRVRLTRRGRIVVATLITAGVVLVAALAWLAGTARAEAAGSGSPASAVYHSLRPVVVQPGESLWTIATQADPAGDPRAVMQEIIDINALNGTSVQPGQRLWLPRG